VLAPETLIGTRIVGSADALDECVSLLPDTMTALRFASDEVFLFGKGQIELGDEHAIVEREVGLSAFRLTPTQFDRLVAPRVEWQLPAERPYFSQGRFLAVPVKLWVTEDQTLVICASAYAHELQERLR
jgi:hypothetical protein